MDFALPDAATLLAYSAAAIVLILTPGPDMTLFVSRTLAGGRAAGLASMAGVMVGLVIHSGLAALGLSALVAASPAAYDVAKWAGALYLAFLAVQAIRSGTRLDFATTAGVSAARAFWTGLGINLLNPKIVLFFVTFLPQFVAPDDPHAAARLGFLGLWYVVLSIPICGGIVLAAERIFTGLGRSPRIVRLFDWLSAGVFALFAVRLALSRAG